MEASVFVRQPNADSYTGLGSKEFLVLPRTDDFLSADYNGSERYFQVIAVHHLLENGAAIEVYAVESEPTWEIRKPRAIGFSR